MDGVRTDDVATDGDPGDPGAPGDPGWGPALRATARALVPGMFVLRWRPTPRGVDRLTGLRAMFLAFAVTLGLIGGVVWFLAGGDGTAGLSGEAGGLLVGAAGVAAVLTVRFLPRPLDCRSDAALAASYSARFFVRLAVSDAPALVGFAMTSPTLNPAMYPLGLAFTAVGFTLLAPTAAHLEADQRDLDAERCGRSLVGALRPDVGVGQRVPRPGGSAGVG
jgi:hypothetical protein